MRVNLTKREIDDLTCPLGRRDVLVFDTEIPGFALRVTDAGAKVFILQYRRAGQVHRLRLGAYGDITPTEARKLAEAARGRVASGDHPVKERRAELQAEQDEARAKRERDRAEALTVDKLIDDWSDKQLASRRPRYREEATRALRRGLASILAEPAHAIDTARVRAAIDRIPQPIKLKAEKGPETKKRGKGASALPAIRGEATARRVRAYGSAMFNWAMRRELVTHNPFAAVRLETREVQRERVLSDAELGEIWRATGKMAWPWGPYLRFLLLTLQRKAEAASLAWGELSLDFTTWTLPGSRAKNGKPHLVQLMAPARAILEAAPRLPGSPLVFTTTGKTPISGFSKAKRALDMAIMKERQAQAERAGLDEVVPLIPWRLHDFRRSGVTVMAGQGVRVEVADKLLNHKGGIISGVTGTYQRYQYFPEREAAMQIWADHLARVGAPIDEVSIPVLENAEAA